MTFARIEAATVSELFSKLRSVLDAQAAQEHAESAEAEDSQECPQCQELRDIMIRMKVVDIVTKNVDFGSTEELSAALDTVYGFITE